MSSAPLLVHLVTAMSAAVLGAAVALRLGQPLIVGYILAGVVIGPFTPGIIGDAEAIAELAEIGVIFLMFVIGAQLSLRELVRGSRVAVFGALLQVAVMIGVGMLAGHLLGWGLLESYAFGAVISNSSSTVLGKILSDRGEIDSRHARLALAWSSVQDISTVALVATLSFFASGGVGIGTMVAKAAAFFLVVVPASFFVLPAMLREASSMRSREFFALAVVTLALAMASFASVLGVSLALGAFFTGVVLGESDLSHRILGDATPLRDVFSGIFFVSIGMLLDPRFVVEHAPMVLLAVFLIVVIKGVVSTLFARLLGSTLRVAVLLGAALAQSAEFSFLLARIGVEVGALSEQVFHLLLSSTIVTILFAPSVHRLAPYVLGRLRRVEAAATNDDVAFVPEDLRDHAVVCGHGRVGSIVCSLLDAHGKPYLVVEEDARTVAALRARSVPTVLGDAGQPSVLDAARLREAGTLILCVPEKHVVRRAVDHARDVNAGITILARTHAHEDRDVLQASGVDEAVLGELELALELGRRCLRRFGVSADSIERSLADVRSSPSRPP